MKIRIITSATQKTLHLCMRTKTESHVVGKVANPLPTQKIGIPSSAKTKFL